MLLVVDDEHGVRQIVIRMLEDAGYRVVAAEDGAQALEVFDQVSVRLVITDLIMPEMTGLQLAERLRDRQPEIPILFMAGFTSPGTGTKLPGPLIKKPFTELTLVQRVRELLEAGTGV